MRIGIYGGSFDPVHKGHINLVRELKRILKLDRIIVVPAYLSPFKADKPPKADAADRLKMVALAFSGEKDVEISDLEIQREGISYTIDTVKEIKRRYPKAELYLLLTDEAFPTFSRWKDHEELESLTKVVYAAKEKTAENFIEIPWIDISSTTIRAKLSRGEGCNDFLPAKVLDYIHQHKLYSNP